MAHQMEAWRTDGVGLTAGQQSKQGKEKGLWTIQADQVPQMNSSNVIT